MTSPFLVPTMVAVKPWHLGLAALAGLATVAALIEASTAADTFFGRVQGNGHNWIELVVTVGPDHGLAAAAAGVNVERPGDALDVVLGVLRNGDVVLVKGSRSVGLEQLADRLTEEARR